MLATISLLPAEIVSGPLFGYLCEHDRFTLYRTCSHFRAVLFPQIFCDLTVTYDTTQGRASAEEKLRRMIGVFGPDLDKLIVFRKMAISLGPDSSDLPNPSLSVILRLLRTTHECTISIHDSHSKSNGLTLLEALESNSTLRSLSIRCYNAEHVDDYVFALANGLQRKGFGRMLSTLRLKIQGGRKSAIVSTDTCCALTAGLLLKSKTLRELEWHVRSENESKPVEEFLRTCTSLETLNLKCGYSSQGYSVCALVANIAENRSARLRQLEVCTSSLFRDDVIKHSDASILSTAFNSLETLVHWNGYTYEYVAQALQHSQSIRHVKIHSASSPDFSSLQKSMSANKSLKSFEIYLVEFNPTIMESVAKAIGASKSIDSASISVEHFLCTAKFDPDPIIAVWQDERFRPKGLRRLCLDQRFLDDKPRLNGRVEALINAIPALESLMFVCQERHQMRSTLLPFRDKVNIEFMRLNAQSSDS
ncbi:hypothetical protein BJ742DRAFT_799384 [Cladochytrium replicatum]|nr:hypothetical protein BJ742DRAFT_799384 [Cladochytrium replicatum]